MPRNLPSHHADPITLEALRYFQQPHGRELLARAGELSGNEWQVQCVLREHFPAEMCRAALALWKLRQRATDKFYQAGEMFFDRDGLEMATREEVAQYRAWRFREHATILDLCCGIGGDLLALGESAQVMAVDCHRLRLEMARLNSQVHGLREARFALADARALRVRADAVFIDPSRRSHGSRVRRAREYEPPLTLVEEVRRQVPEVAVKVSPAIPEEDLPPGAEIEYVSAGGQCREAVLYFGGLASASRQATLLPGPHTLQARSGPAVPIALPGAFVYDPDPAVVRGHLIDELARLLGAWKLDPHIAYLSSDTPVLTPFARAYRVLNWQPFQLKRLRCFLSSAGFFPREIKKRRFPVEPEEMARRLQVRSGEKPVVLFFTRLGNKPVSLICEGLQN